MEPCRFRVLREDDVHGWLGASPDGLIASLTTQGATSARGIYGFTYDKGQMSVCWIPVAAALCQSQLPIAHPVQ